MNQKILLLCISLMMFSVGSASADTCSKCKGRGFIVMNPDNTAGYGLSPVYSTCPICNQTMNINGGPRHTHQCPKCGGTGTVAGRNSSSSGDIGYQVTDEISAAAYIAVHGPKLSASEQQVLYNFMHSNDSRLPAFEKWYSKMLPQYISWRDNLEVTHYYKSCTDSDLQFYIDSATKFYKELNAIHFSYPPEMESVVKSLCRQLDSTWSSLLDKMKYAVQCNRDQQMLDFYILNGLPLPNVINIHVQ